MKNKMNADFDTCAILIAFNPNIKTFIDLCNSILLSNVNLIIVNNGSSIDLKDDQFVLDNYKIINQKNNSGIATAQNIGINHALKNKNHEFFFFFDHDSLLSENFFENIRREYQSNLGFDVMCPTVLDRSSKAEYPSLLINKLGVTKKIYGKNARNILKISLGISSGMSARRNAIELVGTFKDKLFIDHVDTEWFLRARYNGFNIGLTNKAKIYHSIGEKNFSKANLNIHQHNNQRTYYQLRNTLLLRKYSYVPKIFLISQFLRLILHKSFYIFFSENKIEYLRYVYIAIYDGILMNSGPYIKD